MREETFLKKTVKIKEHLEHHPSDCVAVNSLLKLNSRFYFEQEVLKQKRRREAYNGFLRKEARKKDEGKSI